VVAMSYMTVEALHAVDHLAGQGVGCDLIDLRSIRPIDWTEIVDSVKRTGRLLALDAGTLTGSVSGEIAARVAAECWDELKCAPQRLAMPDFPEATSPALTSGYHVRAEHIAERIGAMLGLGVESRLLAAQRKHPHDVPGDWFTGPF
jgi:pyruvate/2-oxoglutarate/acetoin dehydrogenase E1 component